jgi:phosphate starvation-inducible protein PhoH
MLASCSTNKNRINTDMKLSKFKQVLNEWGRSGFPGYNANIFGPTRIAKMFYELEHIRLSGPTEITDLARKTVQSWMIEAFMKDNSKLSEEKIREIIQKRGKWLDKNTKIESRHYYYIAGYIKNSTSADSAKRKYLKKIMGKVMSRAGSGEFREEVWNKYIPIEEPAVKKETFKPTAKED